MQKPDNIAIDLEQEEEAKSPDRVEVMDSDKKVPTTGTGSLNKWRATVTVVDASMMVDSDRVVDPVVERVAAICSSDAGGPDGGNDVSSSTCTFVQLVVLAGYSFEGLLPTISPSGLRPNSSGCAKQRHCVTSPVARGGKDHE
jgi:hypothetical protein